jgi:hypothetical protein
MNSIFKNEITTKPMIKMVKLALEYLVYLEVARWPHGCRRQCSEVAVAALVGSDLTEGGGFFQGRNLRRAMDVCVCLSGADGIVVEGRATHFRHHREVGRFQIPAGWASHGCCVVFVLCRPERRKEKRGWAWVSGESTAEPRCTT